MESVDDEVVVDRPSYWGSGHWRLKNCSDINLILGKNGSGKSVFLRLLRDQSPDASHYIVPERVGDINLNPHLLAEAVTAQGRRQRSQGNFAADYRNEAVARLGGFISKRGSLPTQQINVEPCDLMDLLNLLLPDFILQPKGESPYYEMRRIEGTSNVTSVTDLSSGESQLLTIGLDILSMVGLWELNHAPKRQLLIDEPDAHIHPDLQLKLAQFLTDISRRFKVRVYIATHSTTLLAALAKFGADGTRVFFIRSPGADCVGMPLDKVKRELTSYLGGHILMGPLFGDPILLVEGDDDYRVWLQAVRGHGLGACVLPCNGHEIRKYQSTLETMFSSLTGSADLRGIALLDGDKVKPCNHPSNPQIYIRFLTLSCLETENLYLTDEVLEAIGTNWLDAKSKIMSSAGDYGKLSEALKEVTNCDRQYAKIKPVIRQIADILDRHRVEWSVRVGKVLGKARPTGQLAEFLGKELVDFLWKP